MPFSLFRFLKEILCDYTHSYLLVPLFCQIIRESQILIIFLFYVTDTLNYSNLQAYGFKFNAREQTHCPNQVTFTFIYQDCICYHNEGFICRFNADKQVENCLTRTSEVYNNSFWWVDLSLRALLLWAIALWIGFNLNPIAPSPKTPLAYLGQLD